MLRGLLRFTPYLLSLWGLLANAGVVHAQSEAPFLVGAGRADVTGPLYNTATLGYAAPAPKTSGIHTRLWARSIVIANAEQPAERIVLSVSDLCFMTGAVKEAVIANLQSMYGDQYDHSNVMLAATHTHSGPGGYSHHKFYNVPTNGFIQENFQIIVEGITESIAQAHNRLEPANIRFASDVLPGVSRNRSLAAYEMNPADEREGYQSATDESVSLLSFDGIDGKAIGLAHWVAAHATSIDKTNTLISGDNKGYAAWQIEREYGVTNPHEPGFVALFGNSNAGDASPNVAGDVDDDGDWECAANENFACAKDSGERHLETIRGLMATAQPMANGAIRWQHAFVDMSEQTVPGRFTGLTRAVNTCDGAVGMSMLAGSSEDGPGVGEEGTTCSNGGPLVRFRCSRPRFMCHGEKPVALSTGTKWPVPWTAEVIPLQLLSVGNVAFLAVPSELTTMSGRRLRATVAEVLAPAGIEQVIISGYANAYTHYVATPEEYLAQHYEGASTLFGQWTLPAYQQVYAQLAADLIRGRRQPVSNNPSYPMRDAEAELDLTADVLNSEQPFGTVLIDTAASYRPGDLVEFVARSSNPNHALGQRESFMVVEQNLAGAWQPLFHDWDFNTFSHWQRDGDQQWQTTLQWRIPTASAPGRYRLRFMGRAQLADGTATTYTSQSQVFNVE